MVFSESGFRFDFTNCLSAYKADSITYHDLSAVDFVVETSDNVIFIEVKNPDHPKSTAHSRKVFLNDLETNVYPYLISDKYKNVMLRTWARGEVFSKPIICVLLLEFGALRGTDREKLHEKIFNRLPLSLNKPEFGNKKHFEKRFDLLSFNEFCSTFPMISVDEEDVCENS